MKSNTWIKYLIYFIIIIALAGGGIITLSNYYEASQVSFRVNIPLIILVELIFFGGIGIVLGLDSFINEFKKCGKWRFNIPKFLVLGVSSLILSTPYVWFYLFPSAIEFMDIISTLGNIVFGYILVTCIIKQKILD